MKVVIIGVGIIGIIIVYLFVKEGIDVVLIDFGCILNGMIGYIIVKVIV